MSISIEFKDKYVYFGPEAGLHTQGEARAEVYDVTGPRYHDGHDLSAMTWYVRASHPDYMTIINKRLRVSVAPGNEEQIIITWPVDADFTAYSGSLDVQFVAKSSTGEEIIKLQSNGLQLAASVENCRAAENVLKRWNKCRNTDNASAATQSAADASGRKMLKGCRAKAPRQRSSQGGHCAICCTESGIGTTIEEGDAEGCGRQCCSGCSPGCRKGGILPRVAKAGWQCGGSACSLPTGWAAMNDPWRYGQYLGMDADSSDWINSHKTTDLSDTIKEQADGQDSAD